MAEPSSVSARHASPTPNGLRHRAPGRAATFAENGKPLSRRRDSLFSEGFSDTRRSFRSSTDDLFLPRLQDPEDYDRHPESSHWHSLPVLMALLPAAAGLFLNNGTAILTDIILLSIAAVFMNWALRLPWQVEIRVASDMADSVQGLVPCSPIISHARDPDTKQHLFH